jgi:hypothetical protein
VRCWCPAWKPCGAARDSAYGDRITRKDYRGQGIRLERFAEMARFNYGSTVIVLLPPGVAEFAPQLGAESPVQPGPGEAARRDGGIKSFMHKRLNPPPSPTRRALPASGRHYRYARYCRGRGRADVHAVVVFHALLRGQRCEFLVAAVQRGFVVDLHALHVQHVERRVALFRLLFEQFHEV